MNTLSKADIKQILSLRFEKDTHKNLCDLPLPSALKDSYKAAFRLKEAIEKNEKIAIVGDYDVDGIISCVIMSEFFDDIGFDYELKIPNRFKDGYGLNENMVEELDKLGTKLIITVDNGISANEAALLCEKKGITLIITDHHTPPEILPKAYATINPKQKDCPFPDIEICGAQVAWYLIVALKEVCKLNYDLSKFIELLAIAIIGDMMELRDLNRALIKKGIERLNRSKRPAFLALKNYYQKDKFELDNIGFLIAPLLNSSGRMDDALLSYKFLRSKSLDEAKTYLEKIVFYNDERKKEEKELFEQSLKYIKADDCPIIVSGKDWHEGVLGIVASRLAKHFNKPAFVFSEFEDKAKGSARSVGKIDILKLIESQNDLLLAFGGHKGAAGALLKQENLARFKENLSKVCQALPKEDFINTEELLGKVKADEVDYEMLELLEYFEPFGHKNPRPFFEFNNLCVKNKKKFGQEQRHLKLILSENNTNLEALFFNFTKEPELNEKISLIASISKNSFKGLLTPQLIIKEIL